MSKKLKSNNEFSIGGEEESLPLTHLAISIANIKGTWGLVEVGYNEAGDLGDFKYIPCGGDRTEAIEAFKIKAANTFMK